jgi:hypothetical protein
MKVCALRGGCNGSEEWPAASFSRVYSSALKMEGTGFSETSLTIPLHSITGQKIVISSYLTYYVFL